jgi:hypothetical protein
MKLDVTNDSILDVSPFVDRYSNIIRLTETVAPPRIVTAIAPTIAPLTETVTPKTAIRPTPTLNPTPTTQIPTTPTKTIITPKVAVIPRTIQSTPTPTPSIMTTPLPNTGGGATGGGAMGGGAMGGGAMGGGAMGGGAMTEKAESEQGGEQVGGIEQGGASQKQIEKQEQKSIKGFLGLLIGVTGGYFYAKQNNKNLISFCLIGGAIGIGIGLLYENMIANKVATQPTQPTKK